MTVNMQSLQREIISAAGITAEEAHALMQSRRETGQGFGRVLVQQRKIAERDLLSILSRGLGLEVVERIQDDALDFSLVRGLSIGYLRKNLVLPLKGENGALTVAVADPMNVQAQDDLRAMFPGRRLKLVLAPAQEIVSAVNRTFGQAEDKTDQLMQDLGADSEEGLFSELEESSGEDLLDETSNAPVIKLVNHILSQAVKNGASDIHIEPYQHELKVRFRLDGVLYAIMTLPRRLHAAVVSRIKIMAKLNIAEKRLPQDGRIEVKIGDRQVDLRVSCLPTGFGERVVLRLLEKNARLLSLEELGLSAGHLREMQQLLSLSHGIILVTGPTGSGKTTTLYAGLTRINSPDKNILTIEDPVEYQIDGIGQMQVNAKIDLTFAKGLRSMVRQDPDVILIGEIRDVETAEIAIQAALTGHLVFSTLHTNDSASAVTRLIDMGIEPFLVSSAVRAILAQRLVRVLCPHCKEPYEPTPEQLAEMGIEELPPSHDIHRPKGCDKCMNTGYKGRSAIYELLRMGETMQDLILKTSDSNQIRHLAVAEGMRTMREDGVHKVLEGVTTFDEVLRVTLI